MEGGREGGRERESIIKIDLVELSSRNGINGQHSQHSWEGLTLKEKISSTQVDCHKRRTFRQNLPGGLLDETRLPAEFFEHRLLVLVDISHTVGHQDYTDRHITHCQTSGLHC